jgi:hypothetical protein
VAELTMSKIYQYHTNLTWMMCLMISKEKECGELNQKIAESTLGMLQDQETMRPQSFLEATNEMIKANVCPRFCFQSWANRKSDEH